MAAAGRKSGTIIQALRHLGKGQIDDRVIAMLRRRIDDKDRASLRKDLVHAPAWIADLLRPLTEPTPQHEHLSATSGRTPSFGLPAG